MRSIEMINDYINPPAKKQENTNDLAAVAEKLNDIANTLDAVNLKLEKQQKAATKATKAEPKKETKKESEAVDNGNTEHDTEPA
jgi:hypothetical protein